MNYSNARIEATIEDWPMGRNGRSTAVFTIEPCRGGERCSRVTQKRDGSWSKPKKTTSGSRCRVVDGDDGRTYVATDHGWSFGIMRGDMKYHHESVRRDSEGAELEAYNLLREEFAKPVVEVPTATLKLL